MLRVLWHGETYNVISITKINAVFPAEETPTFLSKQYKWKLFLLNISGLLFSDKLKYHLLLKVSQILAGSSLFLLP